MTAGGNSGNSGIRQNKNKLSAAAEISVLTAESRALPQKTHSHYYCEMLYVMKGTASVTLSGTKYILTKGGVFFIHPGREHSITSGLGTRVASVRFDPGFLRSQGIAFEELPLLLEKAEQSLCAQVFFPVGTLPEDVAEYCFTQCVREAKSTRYGYDIAISSCISRMMLEIIRKWNESGFCADLEKSSASELDINSVTAYIVRHCEEQIRVDELAAKCGMSYSYFARCFRERYGQSCKEYIEGIRIEKAEKLLLFTDHDLSFISQELGFSDCSHLIKVFKKHRGVTPRQFRLQKNINKR